MHYANEEYGETCDIIVMKVDMGAVAKKRLPIVFRLDEGQNFVIRSLSWINDDEFVLKTFKGYDEGNIVNQTEYFNATLNLE